MLNVLNVCAYVVVGVVNVEDGSGYSNKVWVFSKGAAEDKYSIAQDVCVGV